MGVKEENNEEILVTPELLKERAAEWKELLKGAKEALRKVEDASEATEGCLTGKAGEYIRERIKKKKSDGEQLLKALFDLTEKLEKIGLEYEEAEGRNRDVCSGN